ncbi:MAG: hypothetical protein N4A54_04065 [Peptostreptococcaceae bacterium]|jgi:hypothetical protein|nr:hypothetical protein [Peptostreptococcaceae bacterium]
MSNRLEDLKTTYYETLDYFINQFNNHKANFEQCKDKNILHKIIQLLESLTLLERKTLIDEQFEIREVAYKAQGIKNEIKNYIVSLV